MPLIFSMDMGDYCMKHLTPGVCDAAGPIMTIQGTIR